MKQSRQSYNPTTITTRSRFDAGDPQVGVVIIYCRDYTIMSSVNARFLCTQFYNCKIPIEQTRSSEIESQKQGALGIGTGNNIPFKVLHIILRTRISTNLSMFQPLEKSPLSLARIYVYLRGSLYFSNTKESIAIRYQSFFFF